MKKLYATGGNVPDPKKPPKKAAFVPASKKKPAK